MVKVSFDFDGTLDQFDVKVFANHLLKNNYDVWIVTSRYSNEYAELKGWSWIIKQNDELFKIANEIGINENNIIFTNREYKITFLQDKGFLFHLDDDVDELMSILISDDNCTPMNVNWLSWREDLIKKFKL